MTRRTRARLLRPWLLGVLALFTTTCAKNAPQDALSPEGPVARAQDSLFRPVFWIAAAIFFLVEGLIVFAAIKFRDRPGRAEPKQVHGNTRLEFGWTLIPSLIMLGVAIPTVVKIFEIDPHPSSADVKISVVAHQWWWEYTYVDSGEPPVVTANELVIPVGKPILLELESDDVIHSWWVPKLAGKQDVVPGRVNRLQFSATKPGEYVGQCAEFCSVSHANMRLRVDAVPQAEFDRWLRDQAKDAAEPTAGDAARGRDLFFSNACVNCHSIKGTDAGAAIGPNLTHFGSRKTLASVMFPNDREHLFEWIKNPRAVKPGVLMPNFGSPLPPDDPAAAASGSQFKPLSDDDIRAVVAYLLSLV